MEELIKYLPFIIPVVLVEWTLMIVALVHVFRHKNYRIGNRIIWAIIVVVFQIIGPILYFTIGRGDE